MALVVKDRVQEYTTTSGTGTLTLTGAALGFQTFSGSIGNGNTTFYTIYDNIAQVWEVGIGTVGAGTLARTTVLSNSSGTTSPISLAGNNASVFCTYPAEKSVNLDSSGNVSPLGTIASGTWQGTTVSVAYGGTGVTSSSGANSVVLRDANQNILVNSVTQAVAKVTSAAGTTTLTAASAHFQILTGTTTQTFKLPDATTLSNGSSWVFDNDSTGNLTVTDNAGATVDVVAPGGYTTVFLESNATVAGEWGRFGMLPNEVNWGTLSADFGSSTITNATWNGATITSGYGGTGLTTFTAANNALYSTAANTLAAGTLPVAAGGTGAVTLTGYVYGNGTGAFTASTTIPTSALTGNYVSTFSGGSTGLTPNTATTGTVTLGGLLATGYGGTGLTSFTSGGAVYATSTSALTTGTLPIASGGTGQTTASAAFNALSPITSVGDLIVGNGTNSATRLGIGANGYVLASNGTTATWTANASGTTITVTDFTATAGQTTFAATYTVGLVEVYRNGIKLGIADYTATSGTSIVLATGANVGDLIEIVAFTTLNTITTIASELFSGTGSQTVYTMAYNPANTSSVIIAISGVVQDPSTYTVSTNTLTFSTAPPSGTNNISVRYLGLPSSIGITSFSAGTTGLTPSTATTGSVTLAGTLNVANGGTGVTTSTGSGNNVLSAGPTFTSYINIPTWTTGTRPGSPTTGTMGFNSTLGVVETYNGTAWVSGGGLNLQSVQTTGFTAVAGNSYPCNTTSAAFTVTLPSSPTAGNQIGLFDYAGTFATNNLTLGRNGSNITGIAGNYVLSTNRESVILTYVDSTQGWVVSSAAYTTSPLTNVPYTASYLVIAGGGGGGGGGPSTAGGSGGGGGGYLSGTTTFNVGTVYSVTVGAGGSTGSGGGSSSTNAGNGNNSVLSGSGISTQTSIGGGGGVGGEKNYPAATPGQSGGSGGGSGAYTSGVGGSGTPGQGNKGGDAGTGWSGSGAGGGASAAGGNGYPSGTTGSVAPTGGAGTANSITGTPVTYAGGGGAGTYGTGATAGSGGAGGGGAGSNNSNGTSGTANTGGGGGGGCGGNGTAGIFTGGGGGSGVVILSVPTANYTGTYTGTATVTTSGSNTIIKWTTGSGTYTA